MPPPKKVARTGAVFADVAEVHERSRSEGHTPRLSLDGEAPVPIGPFPRRGESRAGARGADHDSRPEGTPTPFGTFRPDTPGAHLFFTDSKASSDFVADRPEQYPRGQGEAIAGVREPVLDLDDGPEDGGQRSQWLLRILLLAQRRQWHVVPAYYPPYHSKYDPIERFRGVPGESWNGALSTSGAAVLGHARNMTYDGAHPEARRNDRTYVKGVELPHRRERRLERWLKREEGVEKWAIDIPPPPPDQPLL